MNRKNEQHGSQLQAWRIARDHGLWPAVISIMQGLQVFYEGTGRSAAWRRLVEAVVPDLVDPSTDGPLSGREEEWNLVIEYRVLIARDELDWAKAERLQHAHVEWNRKSARPVLDISPETWNDAERHTIRSLAVSLCLLAKIQREIGQPDCTLAAREALNLTAQIGDAAGQASCAFELGHGYLMVDEDLRDLDEAERWYRQSLDLHAPGDSLGRAGCLLQIGIVAYRRAYDLRNAKRLEEAMLSFAEATLSCEQALEMTPKTEVVVLAPIHNQLGLIYADSGDVERAMQHYRKTIRYGEASGNMLLAGAARKNAAIALFNAGLPDARAYAEAALVNFETFGTRAEESIRDISDLIAKIDDAEKRSTT